MHKGILPREGFVADPIFRLLGKTVFNPALLLPLILLARFTKRGRDLSILHPLALYRFKALLFVSIAGWANRWYSRKVLNNWLGDKYDWTREIVVVTGGAGGIGGEVVKLFAERGIKVVVLDIQAMTFEARKYLYIVYMTPP